MKRLYTLLIIALLFPIVILVFLTEYKRYILTYGFEVTFPISGYDPRDLFSGHFITYNIEYGSSCPKHLENQIIFYCTDSKTYSFKSALKCDHYIKGVCVYGRFEAGIEKYYIPEDKAKILDKLVRKGQASVVITINPRGDAVVKDLLIDGKSWREQKLSDK